MDNIFQYAPALRRGRLQVIFCEIEAVAEHIKQKEELSNDENVITQRIVDLLQNNDYRRSRPELLNYNFQREAPENSGRVDIKVMINQESFIDTNAYYTIECKRLDAKNETDCTGGSYKDVKKQVDANEKEDVEVHHMPADSASRLDRSEGPAIEMEKADHRLTASCGNSREAIEYRDKQRSLIESGDFRGAVQMDIDDIRSKFGDKYDGQIKQMLSYVDKLKEEGKI